jgi:cellulose synthase/poly-beta-1,6-N-acetylglucosamine synthase-like glycosyltransferase
MGIVELVYAVCAVLLSVYGFNSLILTWLFLRHRDPPRERTNKQASQLVHRGHQPSAVPHVTVQLPIYNELHTVERLLESVARLDYPRNRLEIQLLDDSTDDTRQVSSRAVARLQREGVNVVHITRSDRDGFKAGALAAGLGPACGEFVAIFDADFVPPPDYLRRVVPLFDDPVVGCVQTRWGHLNRQYSIFTEIQALGVDGHFIVEQTARSRAGLFINFNGTAGVWRRSCIDDAGGWQGDTLTEDLDLSYRAQLRGWRIAYLPDVVVPAELPAQISAFKQQQARWAQGSIQTALKLLVPLFRSDQRWHVKLEGAIHLTSYLVHPLMLMLILLTLPMSFSYSWVLAVAPWLMMAAVGPPLMYVVAQLAEGDGWRGRLRVLPLLVLLGMGLALSNTRAVLRAVLGRQESFRRTPKFALRRRGDNWVSSAYVVRGDGLVWGELGLSLFALALLASPGVNWGFAPWLLLYAGGFGYVAFVNMRQIRQRQRWLAKQPIAKVDKTARTPQDGPNHTREDWLGRDTSGKIGLRPRKNRSTAK